jgi:hypothetical protein
MKNIFDIWKIKNPRFDRCFKENIMVEYSNYGGGTTEAKDVKGKAFGTGYELYIYAYFLGLYAHEFNPDIKDPMVLGQPIQYWGNVGGKAGRTDYPQIQKYIFASLIAESDVNLIELDKGNITPESVVSKLINTMEGYANGGFILINEEISNNANYFYTSEVVFLDFLQRVAKQNRFKQI